MKKQIIEGTCGIIAIIILIIGFAILMNNIIKVNKDITNFELEHRVLDSELDSINSRLDRLESIPVVKLESENND